MAENSNIEWTDHTFNPWRGCTKVSAGCTHCYADVLSKRNPGTLGIWGKNGTREIASEAMWAQPLKWNAAAEKANERHRVFCASLADVFEGRETMPESAWEVVEAARDRVFALMFLTPHLDWLVLTKRPENMAEYINHPETPFRIAKRLDAMVVQQAMAATQEKIVPIEGFPVYSISNLGFVYGRGSARCLFCGKDIAGGIATKQYCGAKCRQSSHYNRKQGKPDPFGIQATTLSPDVGDDGHLRVSLYREGEAQRHLVHRLVLAHFDRLPEPGEQACHLDGTPFNNHIANLRWDSQSGNWDDRRRQGNYRAFSKLSHDQAEEIKASHEPVSALAMRYGVSGTQIRNIREGRQWNVQPIAWPPPNFWAGTSVENQAAANERIPALLGVPAAVRFLSCEPLLGPVDLDPPLCQYGCHKDDVDAKNDPPWCSNCDSEAVYGHWLDACADAKQAGINWVIVGGESGPGARPMHPDWARSLRDQCVAAGVNYFFKQYGEWKPVSQMTEEEIDGVYHPAPERNPEATRRCKVEAKVLQGDGSTHDPYSYGAYLQRTNPMMMFKVGKKKAGRLLDEREWNEIPKIAEARQC